MKILYATSLKECHKYLEVFKYDKFLALDVEGTTNGRIELIQIGNENTALLIPIWKIGIPIGLELLLCSQNTVKLVWGPDDEKEFLKFKIKLHAVIDVQQIANAHNYKKSLGDASKQLLTGELEKYAKLEFNHRKHLSWRKDKLSNLAKEYAANDVFSVFYIFHLLSPPPAVAPPLVIRPLVAELQRFKGEVLGYSLFKKILSRTNDSRNEIFLIILLSQAILVLFSFEKPYVTLKSHKSFDITSLLKPLDFSDCIAFLLNTKVTFRDLDTITSAFEEAMTEEPLPLNVLQISEIETIEFELLWLSKTIPSKKKRAQTPKKKSLTKTVESGKSDVEKTQILFLAPSNK